MGVNIKIVTYYYNIISIICCELEKAKYETFDHLYFEIDL